MKLLYHAAASLVMAAVGTSSSVAAYIAPLDGTSVESTFETGAITGMPTIGWTGGGRVFDAGNGAVINVSHPYNNYQVQFITSTPVQPLSTYSLTFEMGYLAGTHGGMSTYSFELGTVNGGTFTALGSAKTGTVPYGGNMNTSWIPTTDTLVIQTDAVVSGDPLAVRWAQTSSLGSGTSDWFGFDNVRLAVEPIPEPTALLLLPAGALILCTRRGRRRR